MSFDHGLLNIPLAKRGDINAQLDACKAKQAAEKRNAAKVVAANRTLARSLFAQITTERLAELAARCSLTPAVMKARLRSECLSQPKLIISLLGAR